MSHPDHRATGLDARDLRRYGRHLVLPDGGLTLVTRGFSENMAHAVLLAVDHPDVAGGRIYNTGDDRQFTLAQWAALVAAEMARAAMNRDPYTTPAGTSNGVRISGREISGREGSEPEEDRCPATPS